MQRADAQRGGKPAHQAVARCIGGNRQRAGERQRGVVAEPREHRHVEAALFVVKIVKRAGERVGRCAIGTGVGQNNRFRLDR